jgi:RNAse (barnase) inhibitor barstar
MDIKKIANKIILLVIILGTPSIGVEIKKNAKNIEESNNIGITLLLSVIILIIGVVLWKRNKKSKLTSVKDKISFNEEKINRSDLSKYIKETYSKIINWNDNLSLQSIYEAGEKDFAKKLLENINNKEEFLKIFNSDFTNEALEKVSLDKKFDVLEEKGDVPIDLIVKLKDFNITNGTLTEKIKKLMILWYKDGANYVRDKIKYDVEFENWDRVKFLLQKFLN